MMTDLNYKNIFLLSSEVKKPFFQIEEVEANIVHIGVGGFHRAHQAYITQLFLNQSKSKKWGICGILLLDSDRKIFDVLTSQDHLYTLMTPDKRGEFTAEVIGSIVELLFAPENQKEVIKKMAAASTKIISMTITEGGYNFTSDGNFNWNNDLVLWDIQHPDNPKTVFGFLYNAIKLRKEQNLGGLTILSCDNLEHNGEITRKMLYAFVQKADPGLIEWIGKNISFPNSMVDRITPVTDDDLKNRLNKRFGIYDKWPVICESFIQWIIEDKFIAGRPDWDKVGAQMVRDVTPYEKMKIRLLNGGHTLVGFAGYFKGYRYIHESVSDPEIRGLLQDYMDREVTPTLSEVPGVDLEEYKRKIIERFGNPFIKDEVNRIISGSSAKFPRFILPTIIDQLQNHGSIDIGVLMVAYWYQYLKLNLMRPQLVNDEKRDELLRSVDLAEREGDPVIFLTDKSIFQNLKDLRPFTEKYLSHLDTGIILSTKTRPVK